MFTCNLLQVYGVKVGSKLQFTRSNCVFLTSYSVELNLHYVLLGRIMSSYSASSLSMSDFHFKPGDFRISVFPSKSCQNRHSLWSRGQLSYVSFLISLLCKTLLQYLRTCPNFPRSLPDHLNYQPNHFSSLLQFPMLLNILSPVWFLRTVHHAGQNSNSLYLFLIGLFWE